jgi:hypothetical protein
MKTITGGMLRGMGYMPGGISDFARVWPRGMKVTRGNISRMWDMGLYADKLLSGLGLGRAARKAVDSVFNKAVRAHERKTLPLWRAARKAFGRVARNKALRTYVLAKEKADRLVGRELGKAIEIHVR